MNTTLLTTRILSLLFKRSFILNNFSIFYKIRSNIWKFNFIKEFLNLLFTILFTEMKENKLIIRMILYHILKLFPMDTSASQGEIDKIIEEYVIEGIETTVPLHEKLIADPHFLDGNYDIHWLEAWMAENAHKNHE